MGEPGLDCMKGPWVSLLPRVSLVQEGFGLV